MLLYTPGEPAGIGPDLILQAAVRGIDHALLVVADPDLLRQRADQLDLEIRIRQTRPDQVEAARPGELQLLPVPLARPSRPGRLETANAGYVLDTLTLATRLCLETPDTTALVTGPIHKGLINEAGIPFTGHTEFLAELSQA
ncbi:MAG TPA: 4-hydroxythreonine-4-phosphate dehydrogenase, partial [Chromatiaceae bacterium]|nr:4-hydroxythreonine-4-phosphate dehydrogenase [Chromatiaceae bacterium]